MTRVHSFTQPKDARGGHKHVVHTNLANPRPQVKGSVVKTLTLLTGTNITCLSEIRTYFSCMICMDSMDS